MWCIHGILDIWISTTQVQANKKENTTKWCIDMHVANELEHMLFNTMLDIALQFFQEQYVKCHFKMTKTQTG